MGERRRLLASNVAKRLPAPFNAFRIAFAAAAVAMVLALTSCGGGGDGASRGVTGEIKLGDPVDLTTARIDEDGGAITINKPGDPLDGLKLVVPQGSYGDSRQFAISYAPVEKHTFGEAFSPITPMITIDNGGTYAEEIMEVEIPVKVPADQFAMGFIYDSKTKTLEGMPLIAQDADSITVGTRHFSNFVISMIPKAKLKKDIDTAFRPGIDDWQFKNRGSYIAPKGHCAGQAITAMWYYYTQPDGKDRTLYGRYDNNGDQPATPDLWQDDSLGQRFASVIQNDIEWDGFANNLWKSLGGIGDELTWNAFAYAMQLTGEPQYVGIRSNAGGGHAMIIYRIKDGNLYIADPNYPGNTERRIEYSNSRFTPYNSGDNAEDIAAGRGKQYESILYKGKTTLIDWNHIAQRWTEVKSKTIGNDRFPTYKITYVDDKGEYQELRDGTVVGQSKVYFWGGGGSVTVFRDGQELQRDEALKYTLTPGNNQLGFWMQGWINEYPKYVDFKYINVVYQPATPTPTSTPTLTATATATPTPAPAAWGLKSIEPSKEVPDTPGDCYHSQEVTIGGLSATTFARCTWTGPTYDVWNRSQHSWSAAPPQRLAPGDKLQITSTVSTEGTYQSIGLSGGGNSWVSIYLQPGGGPRPGAGWAGVTEGAAPDSAVSEFTIPSGGEGGLMLVSLQFQGPGGAGKTTYTYEWGYTGGPVATPLADTPAATPSPTATPTPTPTATPTAVTPTATPTATPPPAVVEEIFKVTSIGAAYNGATTPTIFTVSKTWLVTELKTYHWNNGQGKTPGTIGLQAADGVTYGPWQASGEPGSGGVANAYWVVKPNIVIPPGTYTVLDSDPSTWAQNEETDGAGMSWGKGIRQ